MTTRRDFIRRSSATLTAAGLASFGTVGSAQGRTATAAQDGKPVSEYVALLEAARADTGVTGASFAYWDGIELHTAVAGLRNSATRDPVTRDTVMHVGSITKVTNAALMMQLVDEGRIALDDPVIKHLPEFRLRDRQALGQITCAMLLNHTSGIDGEWLPEYGPDQERIVDAVDRCADLGQLFAPGQEASYNNIATVVAGYLTQKLRGKSWYTLVKSKLYEPLGMAHSLVDPLEVPRFRASIGDLTDTATGKLVQTTRPFLAPSFAPAGSTQMTTAADLVTFARALINGGVGVNGARILSSDSAHRMMTPTAEFVPVGSYSEKIGLGWMIRPGGVLTHGGGGPGVRSELFAHPATGRVLALLTNCDKGGALTPAFLDPIIMSWTGIAAAPPSRRIRRVDTRPYLGTYENNADRYVVTAINGGLAMRTYDKLSTFDNSDQERPAKILFPVGNDTFEGTDARPGAEAWAIRFVRPDQAGKMHFLASWGRLLARTQ